MPRVYNRYTDKDIPQDAVYVGRPSKWGNPFVVGTHGQRGECVKLHEEWLREQPELLLQIKQELAGKDLVCFCAPRACHADTLLMIANQENN